MSLLGPLDVLPDAGVTTQIYRSLDAVASIVVLVGFLPPFQIMKTEAQGTGCDIQDLLFKLSGTGVELSPGLNSSEDEWVQIHKR